VLPLLGLFPLVALMERWTPLCPEVPPEVWAGEGAGWLLPPPPTPGAIALRERALPLRLPSLSS
jgi:hypothetical protein